MPRRKPFTGPVFVHGYLSILDIVWSNSDGQCSYNICIKWSNWTDNIYKNTILLKLFTNICPKVFSTGCPPPSQYWPWLAGRSAVIVSLLTNYFHLKNKIVFLIFIGDFSEGDQQREEDQNKARVLKIFEHIGEQIFFLVLKIWASNVLAHWWANIFLGAQMF